MLVEVFSVFEKLSKHSSMGVLEEEGASCLVAKQAVGFPQVLASV